MKSIPGVSFIIPTYNCKKYIDRAIKSVFDQNLPDFEIIIIDDASTDGTSAHLKKTYKENNNIILVTNKVTKRTGASRNIGIKKASKDYIFFLDADDWLKSNSVLQLLTLAQRYNSEITCGGVNLVLEDGAVLDYNAHSFKALNKNSILLYLSTGQLSSTTWNKLYIRDFILKNKIEFTEYYLHEDVPFTLKCIYYSSKIISSNKISYYYFDRKASYTHLKPNYLYLQSYFYIIFELIKDNSEFIDITEPKNRDILSKIISTHAIDWLLNKFNDYFKSKSKIGVLNDFNNLIKNETDINKIFYYIFFYKLLDYIYDSEFQNQTKVNSLIQQISGINSLNSAQNKRIKFYESKVKSLSQKIAWLNSATSVQNNTQAHLENEIINLNTQINNLKNTKLWRFSEFLRSIRNIFNL